MTTDIAVCPFCKAAPEPGATKCRHCGEWIDGKVHLGGAATALIALVAVQVLMLIGAAVRWAPQMRSLFKDFGSEIPAFTSVVISFWWQPLWAAVLIALVVLALWKLHGRSRIAVLAFAFALGTSVLAVTWWFSMQPLFDVAGHVEAG